MFASLNLAQEIALNFLSISSALAPYAFDLQLSIDRGILLIIL